MELRKKCENVVLNKKAPENVVTLECLASGKGCKIGLHQFEHQHRSGVNIRSGALHEALYFDEENLCNKEEKDVKRKLSITRNSARKHFVP